MDSLSPIYIRLPTPAWDDDIPNHAIVYLIGLLFMQTGSQPSLIKTTHMNVIHASPLRHRCRMPFPPCYINAVGVITAEHYYLSPTFLAMPITISQIVWDGVRTFGLTCVFPLLVPLPSPNPFPSCLIPHLDFVMEFPRLPSTSSFVHTNRYFLQVLPSGEFALEIEDLNYTFPFGFSAPADQQIENTDD